MLIDCFPYFNEREILELRIRTLEDHVDGFLITDANRTHRGEEKEFTCLDTIRELGLPEEKIQVLHVELPSEEEAPDPWVRERGQRDALGVGLHMTPDDTVFICSDCDDIVNPGKLKELIELLKDNEDSVVKLSMSMHYGRADRQLVTPEGAKFDWRNAFASTVSTLKKNSTLSSMRSSLDCLTLGELDAGWHFSWMGDSDRRLSKLKSYAHWETDRPEVEQVCKTFVANPGSFDMLGREDHLIAEFPHEQLPSEIFSFPRVKEYLLPS